VPRLVRVEDGVTVEVGVLVEGELTAGWEVELGGDDIIVLQVEPEKEDEEECFSGSLTILLRAKEVCS